MTLPQVKLDFDFGFSPEWPAEPRPSETLAEVFEGRGALPTVAAAAGEAEGVVVERRRNSGGRRVTLGEAVFVV